MTVFENLKVKNIDEFVDWLYEYCDFDSAPWWKWWDENYCSKCESEIKEIPYFDEKSDLKIPHEFAWCELHDKCRFFQNMDDVPDTKQIIKMWLESEVTNKERECPDCKYFVGCEKACGGKPCDLFNRE